MPEHPDSKLHDPEEQVSAVVPSPYPFAELGVTTNFSFLRGASHPDEMVRQAAHLGYRAIGITDINSLAGVVRMHVPARECGLKLVVGTRLVFATHPDVLVWPADRAAYGRLCQLLTLGKRTNHQGALRSFHS